MSIVSKRLIGLTEERGLETACQVEDLHIGWQREFPQQVQRDPAGHVHLAPVVSWCRDGIRYRFVPALAFVPAEDPRPWLPVQWRRGTGPHYRVDRDQLLASIQDQLLSRGNQGWHSAA